MSTHKSVLAPRELTGKHVLLIMFTFFGIIIAVNMMMATLASKSWTGLVVKNSYVASQKFNIELKEAKEQAASGIHSELRYNNQVLVFLLKDADGETLAAENLTAEIGRPAFEQADQELSFLRNAEDSYKLIIQLEPGIWMIKITGQTSNESYRRDARIYVDENGNGRVE